VKFHAVRLRWLLIVVPVILQGCAREAETAPVAQAGGCPHAAAMAGDSAMPVDSLAIPIPCSGAPLIPAE
jgi:hypothetical protein